MALELRILDRTYKLACETSEEEQLQQAAQLLNQKLQETRQNVPRIENERLLGLVALNLAQEILNLNISLQEQTNSQRLIKQMIVECEQALGFTAETN